MLRPVAISKLHIKVVVPCGSYSNSRWVAKPALTGLVGAIRSKAWSRAWNK